MNDIAALFAQILGNLPSVTGVPPAGGRNRAGAAKELGQLPLHGVDSLVATRRRKKAVVDSRVLSRGSEVLVVVRKPVNNDFGGLCQQSRYPVGTRAHGILI